MLCRLLSYVSGPVFQAADQLESALGQSTADAVLRYKAALQSKAARNDVAHEEQLRAINDVWRNLKVHLIQPSCVKVL